MRITYSFIYINFCLLIALNVALFMESKGLGDVKQYIINLNALSSMSENFSFTSSKSYFYITIFFASRWLGISPIDILYYISYLSYAGTLFLSIKISRQTINIPIFFASFILVLSPFIFIFSCRISEVEYLFSHACYLCFISETELFKLYYSSFQSCYTTYHYSLSSAFLYIS